MCILRIPIKQKEKKMAKSPRVTESCEGNSNKFYQINLKSMGKEKDSERGIFVNFLLCMPNDDTP